MINYMGILRLRIKLMMIWGSNQEI